MIALTNLLHIFPAVIIENGSALFSYALIRLFVWEHCWLLGFLRPVQLFKHSRRCEKRKMEMGYYSDV
jgi:hypothetical protein